MFRARKSSNCWDSSQDLKVHRNFKVKTMVRISPKSKGFQFLCFLQTILGFWDWDIAIYIYVIYIYIYLYTYIYIYHITYIYIMLQLVQSLDLETHELRSGYVCPSFRYHHCHSSRF